MTKFLLNAFFSVVILTAFSAISVAQCDGRYSSDLFDEVTVTEDIQYGMSIEGNGGEKLLKFDLFEPTGDDYDSRAVIILAHGGTFLFGDENDAGIHDLCTRFAKMGYVCASINYRLAELAQLGDFPDITHFMADELVKSIHDMKAAVRYFKKDAATNNLHGVDPDQIIVGGVSAGAILAINLAYMDTDEGFAEFTADFNIDIQAIFDDNGGWEGNSGNDGYSSSVIGVIGLSGAVVNQVFIQPGEEFLVAVHETGDDTVPYGTGTVEASSIPVIDVDGSSVAVAKAELEGIPAALLTFDQVGHVGYLGTEEQTVETVTFIRDFLVDQVTCETVGVEELALELGVSSYPNPTTDYVNIELGDLQNQSVELSIYNSSGQSMMSSVYENQSMVTLNLNDWNSGLYFIYLKGGGVETSQRLIIK